MQPSTNCCRRAGSCPFGGIAATFHLPPGRKTRSVQQVWTSPLVREGAPLPATQRDSRKRYFQMSSPKETTARVLLCIAAVSRNRHTGLNSTRLAIVTLSHPKNVFADQAVRLSISTPLLDACLRNPGSPKQITELERITNTKNPSAFPCRWAPSIVVLRFFAFQSLCMSSRQP